jgi:ribosomal-protein-alanine N-acetyltransferase
MGRPNTEVPGGAEPGVPLAQSLSLRLMRLEDISEVIEMEVRSFTLPWTETAFRREIEDMPHSRLLVAELPGPKDAGEGRIVGYACWWKVVDECHITNVTVSPDYRRQGVGKFLLACILGDAQKRGALRATLEVRASNEVAIALYEKFGFTSVAIRSKYYPDNGEDALVMWTVIAP